MSQDTFPFAEGDEPVAYVDDAERNRKALFIAGGVAAALLLGVAGWFLLSGGDDTTNTALVPHGRPRAVAPAPQTVVKPPKKLPVPYKDRLGRDPFKALYVIPVAAPAAAPAAAAPVAAAPSSGGTGSTTTGTSTTSGGTSTSTGTSGTTTSTTRYPLKLLAISKPNPEVRFSTWLVGGTKVTVIPGQRFGKFGEIVVLAFSKNAAGEVDKAIIQVGDDSPMDVTIGETVQVL